jgi:hypothetical protein
LVKASATSYDTAWLTLPANYITSVTAPLAVTAGNLAVNLSAYLTDAPSDGSQYARQDGSWSVVTGGGGSYLPLAGGTMTGAIVFDGTSGQYISKGNFDTSRGGNYGISLVCSIGYEFNWQAGWLTTTEQNSVTPRPLYLDSLAGTTLRAWNSAADNGVEVSHTGINVANATPYYVNVAPDLVKVFEATNELGVSIAHDSIAIQHIDTPDRTSYFTNEYIGFEDMSGTPHSAWIEHDVITVQDATDTTQMRSTGISLSAGGSITFGDSTVQTTAALPLAGGTMSGGITITDVSGNSSFYGATNWQNTDTGGNYNYSAPGEVLACYFADGSGTRIQGGYIRSFTAGEAAEIVIDPATGITFPDATVQTTAYTGGGGLPVVQIAASAINPAGLTFSPSPQCVALTYPTHTDVLNGTYATAFYYQNDAVGNPALILSGLTALTTANVSSNAAMTTAPDFTGLTALTTATVNDNAAMTSAPSFNGCTSLYTAYVNSNAAMTTAPSFSGLTSLLTATVNNNAAMTTAPDFSGLTSLLNAYANNNAAMTSAPSFSGCSALTNAYANNNAAMTSAPNFTTITQSGIQIYLSGCAISDCTTPLDQLDAGGGTSGYIDLSGGTNQSIDPANISLVSLQGKGWTVIFNSL